MEIKENLQAPQEYKELKLEMSTAEGSNIFTTDIITGCLKSLVLKSVTSVDVEIISEYGYTVYKELQHKGVHYFPLKITSLSPHAHPRNFDGAEFHLNERLQIGVSGTPNQAILIILRYT